MAALAGARIVSKGSPQFIPISLMPNSAFHYSSASPTPVYRYLNNPEHVDSFFSLAALRLSSFANFAQLPEQPLRDAQEGSNILAAVGQGSTLYALTRQGTDCLVLSSTLVPPDQVPEEFRSRGCIMIREPMLFAAAIANVLDGCVAVVVGACTYVQRRSIEIEVQGRDFCDIAKSGRLDALGAELQSLSGYVPMFRKNLAHERQREVRFIFRLNRLVPAFLDISCPDALRYCSRL